MQAVRNFPVPTSVHSIRSFLGLTSYFRRFVKDFSIIAKPLSDLLKKDKISFSGLWSWRHSRHCSKDFFNLRFWPCRTLGVRQSYTVMQVAWSLALYCCRRRTKGSGTRYSTIPNGPVMRNQSTIVSNWKRSLCFTPLDVSDSNLTMTLNKKDMNPSKMEPGASGL